MDALIRSERPGDEGAIDAVASVGHAAASRIVVADAQFDALRLHDEAPVGTVSYHE